MQCLYYPGSCPPSHTNFQTPTASTKELMATTVFLFFLLFYFISEELKIG